MSHTNGSQSPSPDPASELRRRLDTASSNARRLMLYREYLPAILTYNISQAMAIVNEACDLAARFDDDIARAEFLRHRAAVHLMWHSPDALQHAKASYEIYARLYRNNPIPERRDTLAMAAVATGETFAQLNDYESARGYYEEAVGLYGDETSLILGAAWESLGRFHSSIGDYESGLRYLLDSLAMREELEHLDGSGQSLMAMGQVYLQMGEFEHAHASYQRSAKTFKRSGNRALEVLALAGLAGTHYKRGELKDAIKQGVKAYTIHEQLEDWKGAAKIMTTIGNYHEGEGDLDRAFQCYAKAYRRLPASADDALRLPILLSTGRLHARRGELDAALLVLRWALQISDDIGEKQMQCEIHRGLSEALEMLGHYHQALYHYKIFSATWKDLADMEQRRATAKMQIQYELRKAQRERDASLQNLGEFEKEMERKRRDLIETTGQLVQKDAMLKNLPQTVERLREAQGNGRAVVARKLVEQIKCCISTESSWKLFEFQFHSAYPDFQRKLVALCPSLTPRELEICFLAKLGRDTPACALTLGIDVRGVEGHIRNIRKKFALSRDTNFWTFIAGL